MAVDPEEGLITDFMLGMWLVFGADIILLVGFLWAVGPVPTAAFVAVTVLIVAVFASWIGWRWRAIKRLEATDRTPLTELKHQYATGELSEAEFERKLDHLIDADEKVEADDIEIERTE